MNLAEEGKTAIATLENKRTQSLGSMESILTTALAKLQNKQETLSKRLEEALAKANTPQSSPQNGVNRELFDAQLQKLRDQVQNLAEYLEQADSAE
jgi:hypothetical protein